jgi:hypothetical protein
MLLIDSIKNRYPFSLCSRRRLFNKNKIQGSNRQQNNANAEALKAMKRNLQLCILQLSQAIPLVTARVFVFVGSRFVSGDYIFNTQTKSIALYYAWVYVWSTKNAIDALVHYFHFYLYATFSESFRMGISDRVKKIRTGMSMVLSM